MIEIQVEVKNEHGVHARPATKLAQLAGKFSASLVVINKGMEADAKSVISVMMLAAVKGTILTLRADGSDEQAALAEVVQLFDGKFGES